MSCAFDLRLWLAPLSPISSLALCLALFCAPFLAPWSCTLIDFFLHFYSYYIQNKYCIFTLFLKCLSLAPWACLSIICLAPTTPLSITCFAPLSYILFLLYVTQSTLNVYPYILHLCLSLLSCSLLFQHLFCTFGLQVLNLISIRNVFHRYLVIPLSLVIRLVPCLAPFVVPLNAKLQCLRYTHSVEW